MHSQGDGERAPGVDGELIIIMSCPGDHNAWLTKEERLAGGKYENTKGKGMIHTTFLRHASKSGGLITFCPIQVRKSRIKGTGLRRVFSCSHNT